jgi:hypothetical protein
MFDIGWFHRCDRAEAQAHSACTEQSL